MSGDLLSAKAAAGPEFRAYVTESGGGKVTLLVDRDMDHYPSPGSHVTVTPDEAPTRDYTDSAVPKGGE